jgi:hypothetical protein
MNSDVVTMALRMSPVDAHQPDCQPQTCLQSTSLQIEAADSSSQVELSQCQLLDLSSAEQVPLSTVSCIPLNVLKIV